MCPPPTPHGATADGPAERPADDPAERAAWEPYVSRLAPGVHAWVQPDGGWCLNNAGWVTDGKSTLLIDTAATERRARLLRDALLASGAPLPSTVVNTHHHGDHSYGNSVFTSSPPEAAPPEAAPGGTSEGTAGVTPGVTVVGHEACRSEAVKAGYQLHTIWPATDFGDIALTPPDETFSGRLTLHVGQSEVQLLHPGVAHTLGDTIVWLPGTRTVFTGDLVFNGGTPFVLMGSLSGSLHALERLRELEARTVVPGHGPPAGPEVYDTVERYLRYVQELARGGHARGLTPLETALKAELGEFAALAESERLVANLHRAYAEIDGRPLGDPLDVAAIWGEMTRMNGGNAITSHA